MQAERKPIGILGGGQLARMLTLEAHRLGLSTAVLSTKGDDPAALVAAKWHQGDPNRVSDLAKFFALCEAVTFESEFFDAAAIAEASRRSGVPVFPEPSLMAQIQDRKTQKELLDAAGLPTAAWRAVDSQTDAGLALRELGEAGVVFKKRRFGYDGYGTTIVRPRAPLSSVLRAEACTDLVAESFVRFRREIALMAVCDQQGGIAFLPWVETQQSSARCLWVKGPLRETARMRSLRGMLKKWLQQIGYVGAIGIECFELKGGAILINELAPRVHNSGHYSLDALSESQFLLHVRACLGERVESPALSTPGFAMWNLLGSEQAGVLRSEKAVGSASTRLHWYGKSEARPGRKLGHVNAWARTADAALKLAQAQARRLQKQIGY